MRNVSFSKIVVINSADNDFTAGLRFFARNHFYQSRFSGSAFPDEK
jgi:hypothetical protein